MGTTMANSNAEQQADLAARLLWKWNVDAGQTGPATVRFAHDFRKALTEEIARGGGQSVQENAVEIYNRMHGGKAPEAVLDEFRNRLNSAFAVDASEVDRDGKWIGGVINQAEPGLLEQAREGAKEIQTRLGKNGIESKAIMLAMSMLNANQDVNEVRDAMADRYGLNDAETKAIVGQAVKGIAQNTELKSELERQLEGINKRGFADFSTADMNGDGKVSRTEKAQAVITGAKVQNTFDLDRDGEVELNELVKVLNRNGIHSVQDLDNNGNRSVGLGELASTLTAIHKEAVGDKSTGRG